MTEREVSVRDTVEFIIYLTRHRIDTHGQKVDKVLCQGTVLFVDYEAKTAGVSYYDPFERAHCKSVLQFGSFSII